MVSPLTPWSGLIAIRSTWGELSAYKIEVELVKYKRDMMAIELEKEKIHLKLMEAENKKYDRIIEEGSK
jgi:hypothetical protein